MSPKFLFRLDLETATADASAADFGPNSAMPATAGAQHGGFRTRPANNAAVPGQQNETISLSNANSRQTARAGSSVQPLSDYALASRLSYFLWSSMPDDELLAHATAPAICTARSADGAGAPDAAIAPRPRPGPGVRRQLAGLPPLRGA